MREISRLCSEKAVSGKHETKPRPMAKGQVEGGNALRAARAAEIDAASHRPTAAQKQQQIAELEERAVLFGDPVKQSAQANRARAQVAAVFAGAWRGVQVRRACLVRQHTLSPSPERRAAAAGS